MKYKLVYCQCDHTGEYGLIPKQAPDEWIVSTEGRLLAHDILEHNLNDILDNLVLDEFRALGVVYNYRGLYLDNDIIGLFENIFYDDEGYVSDEYLEYHYKNEYYDWFLDIANRYFDSNDYYNDSNEYSHLTSNQIVDRVIRCCAYYFNQGYRSNTIKPWCFDTLHHMIDKFFKYEEVQNGCIVQVIATKEVVRILDNNHKIIYCNG